MNIFRLAPVLSRPALLSLALLTTPLADAQTLAADALNTPLTLSVEGNSLLPEAQLQQLLQPIAPPLNMAKIRARADALQAAYREAGYGTVLVLLPEQTVERGTLRLQVVEGKLDQIYVQGNQRFERDNILHSLPGLARGQTPNLIAVDTNTQQANENPAKSTRVVFQPSDVAGRIDALVVTRERAPQQFTLGLDNSGSESTGHYRASLAYLHANLFGGDQQLGLRGEVSPDFDARSKAVSLSYLAPRYTLHSALEFTASYSDVDSKAIATPAGDALFSGRGDALGLRYRWYLPKHSAWRQKVYIGLDQRHYRNDCSVGLLGAAGCGSADASIAVRPLTLAYDAQLGTQFSANLQLVYNLLTGGADGAAADFEAMRTGAPAHYSLLRGSLAWQQALSTRDVFNWRTQFQYSRNALVPGEQFGAGGLTSVRGYQERELVADSGLLSSVEGLHALLRRDDGDAALYAAAFADGSLLLNQRHTPCRAQDSRCRIGSLGLGLRGQYQQHLQLRLDAARAYADAQRTARGDYRLHFSLAYGF